MVVYREELELRSRENNGRIDGLGKDLKANWEGLHHVMRACIASVCDVLAVCTSVVRVVVRQLQQQEGDEESRKGIEDLSRCCNAAAMAALSPVLQRPHCLGEPTTQHGQERANSTKYF